MHEFLCTKTPTHFKCEWTYHCSHFVDSHGITMTTHQHTHQIKTRNGQSYYNDDCTWYSMDSLCSFREYGHMDAHSSHPIPSHPITSHRIPSHPVSSHFIASSLMVYHHTISYIVHHAFDDMESHCNKVDTIVWRSTSNSSSPLDSVAPYFFDPPLVHSML